jgi:hypothetical protein
LEGEPGNVVQSIWQSRLTEIERTVNLVQMSISRNDWKLTYLTITMMVMIFPLPICCAAIEMDLFAQSDSQTPTPLADFWTTFTAV